MCSSVDFSTSAMMCNLSPQSNSGTFTSTKKEHLHLILMVIPQTYLTYQSLKLSCAFSFFLENQLSQCNLNSIKNTSQLVSYFFYVFLSHSLFSRSKITSISQCLFHLTNLWYPLSCFWFLLSQTFYLGSLSFRMSFNVN